MSETTTEHFDLLIIGAGLSGIGAACHLQSECPGKTYAILESRDAIGGTWDLFRYPGIRSDSDMYTLGYSFKPWEADKAIADGHDILTYVTETAAEHDVDQHIRFNQRAIRSEWSTEDARWTVEVERTDSGGPLGYTADFVFMCSGYYNYENPYTPEFPGIEKFGGRVVHPQKWTEDVDYEGKQVVVIGSGATAVTLVPAMTDKAAHVTMLQRSPTYIVSLPAEDPIAKLARRILPKKLAYRLVRWKNVRLTMFSFELSRRRPSLMKRFIRAMTKRALPAGYDIDTHFKPTYDPWDQRLCLVPDSDLFKAISRGEASVVTGHIETFTEDGIRLSNGEELEADLIITATGLNLLALGGLQIVVDGREVELPETMAYKGMMLSDVPNMAFAIGYTNASWTLKCDLTCEYVCRLINHMDEHGFRYCAPRQNNPLIVAEPFLDFTSGYVQRSIDQFPKQGSEAPWRLYQNYPRDIKVIRRGELEDGIMEFSSGEPVRDEAAAVAA